MKKRYWQPLRTLWQTPSTVQQKEKRRQQQHLVEESKEVIKGCFRASHPAYRTFFCTPHVFAHIAVPKSLSLEAAIHAGQIESSPHS
jgi:hypothetical protein